MTFMDEKCTNGQQRDFMNISTPPPPIETHTPFDMKKGQSKTYTIKYAEYAKYTLSMI